MGLAVGLAIFAVACLIALAATPWVGRLTARCGLVDCPDGHRKTQTKPIPLGGGLAVVLAAGIAGLLAQTLLDFSSLQLTEPFRLWRAFLPAAAILLVVGVVDDARGLTGIYKLIGQVLAATVLVAGGVKFGSLRLFGFDLGLGDFGIPFTVFFVLGAINAFNLIDGSDALASSIGAVVCVSLGVIAGRQGDAASWILCFAVAGGLVGFLAHNAPPARIFLGDAGSMLIGLTVAAAAVNCSIKRQAAFALAVPIAICAIPILDSAAALVRRIATGQSVFTADRGHLHHALLHRGLSAGLTAATLAGLTAITCAGAVISYLAHNEIYALVATIGVGAVLAGTRIFGHAELRLLLNQVLGLSRSAVGRSRRFASLSGNSAVTIQGQRQWDLIWSALCEAAPAFNLTSMKLNLNIPRLHESFFGSWESDKPLDPSDLPWRVTVPLALEGREVGKLTVYGAGRGNAALREIQSLAEFLEPLEEQVQRLIREDAERQATSAAGKGALPNPPATPLTKVELAR